MTSNMTSTITRTITRKSRLLSAAIALATLGTISLATAPAANAAVYRHVGYTRVWR